MACKFRGFASATNTGLCALTPRPATPRNFCRLQVAVPPLTKRQTRPIGSSPIAAAANMSSMAGVGPYDPENIFSKILDGKVPSYKVFETEHSLAFLDAFPMVPGHSLLIPKVKGYATMDEMPAEEAGKFLADLPRLVQAVQAATGCEGVNVCQNNGPAAGQVVFHPHFHVIPRSSATDNLEEPPVKYGRSSKQMITPEEAKELLGKMQA